ncbi:MAG: hypothetical protein HN348_26095, partial [Proteobacteria bacterium]|nr:hypothetical protein [Pseudomonadota bacterium]
MADYDVDGFVDILGRKAGSHSLFHNDGDGTFSAVTTFVEEATDDDKGAVLFCDFDNDLDFDIFWGEPGDNVNVIYRNDGGSWTPVSLGVAEVGYDGADCADVDNDGDLDLFLAHDGDSDLLLINTDPSSLTFTEDVTLSGNDEDGKGAVFGDYDRDGDMDLFVNTNASPDRLWKNDQDDDNYLMVRVLADVSQTCVEKKDRILRDDIGATLTLRDGSGAPITGIREINGGRGLGSQGYYLAHFGLPQSIDADTEIIVEVNFSIGYKYAGHMRITPAQLGEYQLLQVVSSDIDGDSIPSDLEFEDTLNLSPFNDDVDGDLFNNWSDDDADGDGIPDTTEAMMFGPCDERADSDGDGTPNYLDLDSDGDGIDDLTEGDDDVDADGLGNYLDDDSDDDGVDDEQELLDGTSPIDWDSDDDGLSDGEEFALGTGPLTGDSDADGLGDADELVYGSNPLVQDSDGDGLTDGNEVYDYGSDPASADPDEDGLTDDEELLWDTDPNQSDSDEDGLSDGDEIHTHFTDPKEADTDGDLLPDAFEVDVSLTDPNKGDSDGGGVDDHTEIFIHRTDPLDENDDFIDSDGD